MKKLILLAMILISGCATAPRIVSPVAPTELKSKYRKTTEVVLVSCQEKTVYIRLYDGHYNNSRIVKEQAKFSIVEATDTGERFRVNGCYGNVGDRFKITY